MNFINKFCVTTFIVIVLTSCSTHKKIDDSNSNQNNIVLTKSLPVGIVDLTCETQKIEIVDGKSFCLSKIIEIHGYGNSVKALSEGMEYKFEVSNNLLE